MQHATLSLLGSLVLAAPGLAADDFLEQNDACLDAQVLASGFHPGLDVTPTDDDWFRFEVPAGSTLTFDAFFEHAAGNVDLELYGGCGLAPLQVALSTTDDEQLIATNLAASSVDWFVRVFGDNDYALTACVAGPGVECAALPDAGEPTNDTFAGATEVLGGLCLQDRTLHSATDEDWYRIDRGNDGATLTVELAFVHDRGDLDLEVYDSGGTLIAASTGSGDLEAVTGLPIDVVVRVFPAGGGFVNNVYDLAFVFSGELDFACEVTEDMFEPNDCCATAMPLAPGYHPFLSVMREDDDWFRFDVPAAWSLGVVVQSRFYEPIDWRLHAGCLDGPLANVTETDFGAAGRLLFVTNESAFDRTDLLEVWEVEGPPANCGGYSLRVDVRPPHPSFCAGDGGDQAGCTPCPCGNEVSPGSVGGCTNVSGTSAVLSFVGTASVSFDSLSAILTGANPLTFALLVSGDARAPANPTNPCFGLDSGIASVSYNGLRCVVQGLRRHGVRASDEEGAVGVTTPPWGAGSFHSIVMEAGCVAGQTRHFQAMYREMPFGSCAAELNTTQGVSVTVAP